MNVHRSADTSSDRYSSAWSTSSSRADFLNNERKQEYKGFFENCKSHSTDIVSLKHLKIILDVLEIDRPQDVIKNLEPDPKGFVPFSRLTEIIKMKKLDKFNEEEVRRAFKLMDGDLKGFLTLTDLKKINDEMDEKMSAEELQEMLDEVDVNDCGIVTEDTFVRFMKKAAEDSVSCNCG